jgi:catechol 2,3-dioxygenase-like lactoylglutathione lyase family enzyme
VSLNHVALVVSDREASAAFYGRHFGLTRRVHDDEHLLILGSAEGGLLALREGRPVAIDHFGLELGGADEVRRARERLRDAGVTETEWQDDDFARVQVEDPDGHRVELFAGGRPSAPPRSRWTSFVADGPRTLHEDGNPRHRLRVEHNRHTLLVHLSDEDGSGWTVLAVDRDTRRCAVAQALTQAEAAKEAFARLYSG